MTIVNFSSSLPDLKWVEVAADGDVRVQEGTLDATDLRQMLGGTPEQSRSPWRATVFIRTDTGSALPVNWLATMLLRQSLTPGQQVRGPMVVLGPPDEQGEVTAISDELVDGVLDAVVASRGPR